jgi:HD-like signal output (HDOD) protein
MSGKTAVNPGLEPVWTHSVAVSNCARLIARFEGADRKVQDEAYVSGLLHDVGKLVLLANLPDEGHRARQLAAEKRLPEWQAEREVFGADHAAVGGYLLGLWGLPVPVVEAVALHHEPALGTAREFSPLAAVHAANAIVHGPEAPLDSSYLQLIGVPDRVDGWRTAWLESATGLPVAT